MFWEIWQYVTTSCPRPLREMGYLRDSVALGARHRRLKNVWADHLQKTRSFILESIPSYSLRKHAVVFGSGWLMDVPLAELSEQFQKITLVDVIHPREIQKKVKRYPNVDCRSLDVSGAMASFYSNPERAEICLPNLMEIIGQVDYGISVNILSQIPILLLEYLQSKVHLTDHRRCGWTHDLQQGHLELLKKLKCPLCLISDTEATKWSRTGEFLEREKLIPGISLPNPMTEWIWPLAPLGEISKDYRLEHRVAAWMFHVD